MSVEMAQMVRDRVMYMPFSSNPLNDHAVMSAYVPEGERSSSNLFCSSRVVCVCVNVKLHLLSGAIEAERIEQTRAVEAPGNPPPMRQLCHERLHALP